MSAQVHSLIHYSYLLVTMEGGADIKSFEDGSVGVSQGSSSGFVMVYISAIKQNLVIQKSMVKMKQ